eukprot:scaffold14149_cov27-Tisochrysis_lutea.AAC.1
MPEPQKALGEVPHWMKGPESYPIPSSMLKPLDPKGSCSASHQCRTWVKVKGVKGPDATQAAARRRHARLPRERVAGRAGVRACGCAHRTGLRRRARGYRSGWARIASAASSGCWHGQAAAHRVAAVRTRRRPSRSARSAPSCCLAQSARAAAPSSYERGGDGCG